MFFLKSYLFKILFIYFDEKQKLMHLYYKNKIIIILCSFIYDLDKNLVNKNKIIDLDFEHFIK